MSQPSFFQLINDSELPVLVDFWAEWCGPCHAMAPQLKKVATELKGKVKVIKLNVDKNPQIAQQFGIRGIPTLILFHKGKPIWRHTGFVNAGFIQKNVLQAIA